MLSVANTEPVFADQAATAIDGIGLSSELEPSYAIMLISIDCPNAIEKLGGSNSMPEMQGSIAGMLTLNPESGLTGTIALSSANDAVATMTD